MPYSFSIAKQVIDEMFNITDKEMSEAMIFAYNQSETFFRTGLRCWFCGFKEIFNIRILRVRTP